jgi:hypothetical protein
MANPENLQEQTDKMKNGLAHEVGALGGKAKAGSKHLSTLIREIGENIDWDKTTLKNKEQMKALYGNNGWKAIVYVAMTKSMAGDAKAMEWLAKHGYGQNIDITSNGETIKGAIIEFAQKPTDDTSA